MALFVTLEGGEGSGKSFQAWELYQRMSRKAISVRLTHEPGGTPLGDRVSHWLKWQVGMEVSPLTELLFFNASRSQLVDKVIRPELAAGRTIICDRFADSTIAYQGYGRGLAPAVVRLINDIATQGTKPDLTVLLDISVADGMARKKSELADRFEKEDIAFHERVRQGYLKLANEEPERWLVVDANQPKEKIAETIWRRVSSLLAHQED
jgi:dTMP kinase